MLPPGCGESEGVHGGGLLFERDEREGLPGTGTPLRIALEVGVEGRVDV